MWCWQSRWTGGSFYLVDSKVRVLQHYFCMLSCVSIAALIHNYPGTKAGQYIYHRCKHTHMVQMCYLIPQEMYLYKISKYKQRESTPTQFNPNRHLGFMPNFNRTTWPAKTNQGWFSFGQFDRSVLIGLDLGPIL